MIDFEGRMSKPSWRSKHQVVFEEEDDDVCDLAHCIASVSTNDREANIDTNVPVAFTMLLSIEKHSSPSSDVSVYKAMNLRGKYLSLVRLLEVATSLLNLYL